MFGLTDEDARCINVTFVLLTLHQFDICDHSSFELTVVYFRLPSAIESHVSLVSGQTSKFEPKYKDLDGDLKENSKLKVYIALLSSNKFKTFSIILFKFNSEQFVEHLIYLKVELVSV